jgi:DNA-binding IclR family transcriptional regulator
VAAPRRPAGESRRALLDALRGRPMVEKELAGAIGLGHSSLTRLLAQLRREGLITRGYCLTEAANVS